MKLEATSTCQACGARIPAALDYCPVCAFRGALDDARDTSEFDVDLTHSSTASRFDHYQLLTREDGTPFKSLLNVNPGGVHKRHKVDRTYPQPKAHVKNGFGIELLCDQG